MILPVRSDALYMKRALRLAMKGLGQTRPNPAVGSVVVRNGRIVGAGYHEAAGSPHAEVRALDHAGKEASGATLYVTLEPCCHTNKRTPPCTEAIIERGVRRVVVAMRDPHPKVAGRGLARLEAAGIETTEGVLSMEAERLNPGYLKFFATGSPYVILKSAMTMDGQIATAEGQSRWITGEAARADAHRLRARVDAILVGVGTVRADNPHLTVRGGAFARHRTIFPVRVVIDPRLEIPITAAVCQPSEAPTLLLCTANAKPRDVERLQQNGIPIEILPDREGWIPFEEILAALTRRGLRSVLIEGGATVNAIALKSGRVDQFVFYVAPMLFGGNDATLLFSGPSVRRLSEAVPLQDIRIKRMGADLRVMGYARHTHLPREGGAY